MNIDIGFKCGKCVISNTKTISKGKRDVIYFILNEIAVQKQVITSLTFRNIKMHPTKQTEIHAACEPHNK